MLVVRIRDNFDVVGVSRQLTASAVQLKAGKIRVTPEGRRLACIPDANSEHC